MENFLQRLDHLGGDQSLEDKNLIERSKLLLRAAVDRRSISVENEIARFLRLPMSETVRHDHCGLINSELAAQLANYFKLPSIAFTIHTEPGHSMSLKNSWIYHTLCLVQISDEPSADTGIFAAIDETTKMDNSEYFLEVGNLQYLNNVLHTTFGGIWELDFVPTISGKENFSIPGRFMNAQELSSRNTHIDRKQHMLHIYSGIDDTTDKLLGLGRTIPLGFDLLNIAQRTHFLNKNTVGFAS